MKISDHFKLGASQFELDFVDIDFDQDIPLFIDPYFLRLRTDQWSVTATRYVDSFFQHFINLMAAGKHSAALDLFSHLHEPNETCMGLSKGKPRGNGVGNKDSLRIFDSIKESKAAITGILEDLEDFRLFIPGVDKDKLSDMTTNVIRKQLVEYTKQQCLLWGIPLRPSVSAGFVWDYVNARWTPCYDDMLVVDGRKILLVPKGIVSFCRKHTPEKYFNQFVLEYLQHEEIKLRSGLVQKRGDGTLFVTKKSLKERIPYSKEYLAEFTQSHPEIFKDFKQYAASQMHALTDNEITGGLSRIVVADYLLKRLPEIPAGSSDATAYHRYVTGVLEMLLYPHLVAPNVEKEIHDGRKRIDITFDNASTKGFFHRLHMIHKIPCQYIFVECKNYSSDVKNPELDQLAGRFSPNRGQMGLLLSRRIDDMPKFIKRCADTYKDGRGLIIPVVDDDIVASLTAFKQGGPDWMSSEILTNRIRKIIVS